MPANPYLNAPFQRQLLATAHRICEQAEWVRATFDVQPLGKCVFAYLELEFEDRRINSMAPLVRPWTVVVSKLVMSPAYDMIAGHERRHMRVVGNEFLEELKASNAINLTGGRGDLLWVRFTMPHQSTVTGTTHVLCHTEGQLAAFAIRFNNFQRDYLQASRV